MKNATSNAKAAAVAAGLLTSVSFLVLTLVAHYTGYATHLLELIVDVYPFYTVSVAGAFWGALWGFLDAAIGVWILVWLYNMLSSRLK